MRKFHRQIALVAAIFGLFISITGLMVQSMDIASELSDAPATDPTVLGRRAGLFGPPNFQVIDVPDFTAKALPGDFDYPAALATTVNAARAKLGEAAISFVQFRMNGSQPVGQVASQAQLYSFDAASGAAIGSIEKIEFKPISTPSTRNTIKDIHRMRWFGRWAILADILAGLTMAAMIVSGLVFYTQLWRARLKASRWLPFWSAGTWWRTVHRCTAIASGLFLSIIAVTGTILAISSLGVTISTSISGGPRPAITTDLSRPLALAEMAEMLATTLKSYHSAAPEAAIKVLRIRYFAGMPQGVVVTGGDKTDQIVFNTATGQRAGMSEPNYPAPGQTFGWEVDEVAKKIHRGDAFGITGMWLSLISGFALLYLSISGCVMYFDLWSRRAKQGKRQIFWR